MQNSTEMTKQTRNEVSQTDIVKLILEDHKSLRELIELMKDTGLSNQERFNVFNEFAPTLVAHAKPEEETLYVFMKKEEDLRQEAFEGEVEHQLADQLVEEIKRTSDPDLRAARIKVLAELVEHHIEEEEQELLPDFKKNFKAQKRSYLGRTFLELKLKYLAAGDDNIIPDPETEGRTNPEEAKEAQH